MDLEAIPMKSSERHPFGAHGAPKGSPLVFHSSGSKRLKLRIRRLLLINATTNAAREASKAGGISAWRDGPLP